MATLKNTIFANLILPLGSTADRNIISHLLMVCCGTILQWHLWNISEMVLGNLLPVLLKEP